MTRLFLLAIMAIGAVALKDGSRLIAFNETHRMWMSPAEVEKLIVAKDVLFMDITNHAEVVARTMRSNPFPNQPLRKEEVNSVFASLDPTGTKQRMGRNLETFGEFYTRYYRSNTGVQSTQWLMSVLEGIISDAGRSDVTASYFEHSDFPQNSIIVRIPGSTNPSEIVIVGSHIDSVGSNANGRAPGMDDDGSGTMCNMEVLRALLQFKFFPERTLEFHFYAAEEAGLLGSQDIAADYAKKNVDVISMLQLDMTMYVSASQRVGVITDRTSADMQAFMRLVIDAYANFLWENSQCGYGCSDHAPWNQHGYHSSFIFEAPFGQHNPRIHTQRDTLKNEDGTDYLSLDRGFEFVRMAIGYAVEMAYH